MPEKKLMTRDTMTGPIATATKDGRGYTIKSTKDRQRQKVIFPFCLLNAQYVVDMKQR